MIYLAYFISANGNLLWNYAHPALPSFLKKNIEKIGHNMIISMLSAFSAFGAELFQKTVNLIEFEEYRVYFEKIPIRGKTYVLSVAITDKNEPREKVRRILKRFIQINEKYFSESYDESYLMDMDVSKRLSENFSMKFRDLCNNSIIFLLKRRFRNNTRSLILTVLIIYAVLLSYTFTFSEPDILLPYTIPIILVLTAILLFSVGKIIYKTRKKYYRPIM